MKTAPVLLISALTCFVAHADIITFQTATKPATYVLNGGGTINSSQWIAEQFTITQDTMVTDIGGAFTYQNNKPIFGALINGPLPSQNLTWYKNNMATLALAYADFKVPSAGGGGFVDAPLSVLLHPGTYELVFGSGTTANPVLGATGAAAVTICCSDDPGNEMLIKGNFPVAWQPNAQAYLFVKGTTVDATVPEPTSTALLGGVLLFAGAALRRRL